MVVFVHRDGLSVNAHTVILEGGVNTGNNTTNCFLHIRIVPRCKAH